jgi:hypothetical protein
MYRPLWRNKCLRMQKLIAGTSWNIMICSKKLCENTFSKTLWISQAAFLSWTYINEPQHGMYDLTNPLIQKYLIWLVRQHLRVEIAQSVQRWPTGWTIGVLRFDSRRGLGIFLFSTASRTALGPAQPLIQWVPGALSLGVKRPGCEADHSLPSSAEVKEWVELYLHSPNTPPWHAAQLKHRDNFTFYINI